MKRTFFAALAVLLLIPPVPPLAAEGAGTSEKIQLKTQDGVLLAARYARAARPKGAVILLPMLSKTKQSWFEMQTKLTEKGFSSLALDLRGHGESVSKNGREIYWRAFSDKEFRKMTLDVEAAYRFLLKHEGFAPQRIFIMGASIGANLALRFGAGEKNLGGVLSLSPGLDYRGVETEDAARSYQDRPVFYAASRGDLSSYETIHYLARFAPNRTLVDLEGEAHGTEMLERDSYLNERILNWLEVEQGRGRPEGK